VKAAPGYVPAEDERHTDDSDHDGSNMLPSESEIAEGALTLQEARREFERRMIRRALERHGWNVTRAAGELGMERTALHKKMKSLGLEKGGV
jgi:DNA-binding NtrC family response regulator